MTEPKELSPAVKNAQRLSHPLVWGSVGMGEYPTEMEVRTALWYVWSQIPPNVRRELDLPIEVTDICNRNWRDIEFAGSRLKS